MSATSSRWLLTALALLAFAGNSVLCRMALSAPDIDPFSFTAIRLISGALLLWLLCQFQSPKAAPTQLSVKKLSSWYPAIALFIYALGFSYAYISLTAATGALILFFSVQITLIAMALSKGQSLVTKQIIGLLLALVGITYLLLPGAQQPPLVASLLMVLAGVAWGVYTFLGASSTKPLLATRNNFVLSIPIVFATFALLLPEWQLSMSGVFYAVLSGAVTSGIGYALWYAVLPHYSAVQSGVLQLTVPIITAVAGVILIDEPITQALVVASLLTLSGLLLVMLNKR